MNGKSLITTLSIVLLSSVAIYSTTLSSSGFNKYKDKLMELGHTENEILQMEEEYYTSSLNKIIKKNNTEIDLILTEYIDSRESYEKFNYDDKEVKAKPNAEGTSKN